MGNKKSREIEFDAAAELTEEQIELLLKSTSFERNKIEEFYQNYTRLYPSGKIDSDQFQILYKQLFPFKDLDSEAISAIFTAFDDNCSGTINFTEFLTAISISGKADVDDKLHLAFKMYDTDRSGTLELDEVAYIVKGLRGIAKSEDNEDILDVMDWDKNENGMMTEEEFIEFVKSHPKIYKHFLDIVKLND